MEKWLDHMQTANSTNNQYESNQLHKYDDTGTMVQFEGKKTFRWPK